MRPGTLQFSKKIILDGVSFLIFSAPRSWRPVFPSRPWLVRVLRKDAGTPVPQSLGFLQAWSSGWHLWKAGPHHCPGAPGGPPAVRSILCLLWPSRDNRPRQDRTALPTLGSWGGWGEQRPGATRSPLCPDPSPRGVT